MVLTFPIGKLIMACCTFRHAPRMQRLAQYSTTLTAELPIYTTNCHMPYSHSLLSTGSASQTSAIDACGLAKRCRLYLSSADVAALLRKVLQYD